MAIILPHGVLFRGGAEERIRTQLLKKNDFNLNISRYISTAVGEAIKHRFVIRVRKRISIILVSHRWRLSRIV